MQKNVGGYDRIARLLVGAALLALGRRVRGRSRGRRSRWLGGLVLAKLGWDLLATAATQRCPANALLGVNTCEQDADEAVERANRTLRGRVRSLAG